MHDRGRDERAEQHAQRDGDDRRPAERRDRLGESRVMDGPRSARFVRAGGDRDARRGGIDRADRDVGAFAGHGDRIAREIGHRRDRLGIGLREVAVVALPPFRIAQDAAGMIDEPQRLFDVALPIARLRVILPDQAPQRRSNLLVRGGWRDSQRFVKRGSHRIRTAGACPAGCGNLRGNPFPRQVTSSKIRAISPKCCTLRNGIRRRGGSADTRNSRARTKKAASRLPSSHGKRPVTRPSFPCARGRASRESAPICRTDRAGSRAWRGARRPCA